MKQSFLGGYAANTTTSEETLKEIAVSGPKLVNAEFKGHVGSGSGSADTQRIRIYLDLTNLALDTEDLLDDVYKYWWAQVEVHHRVVTVEFQIINLTGSLDPIVNIKRVFERHTLSDTLITLTGEASEVAQIAVEQTTVDVEDDTQTSAIFTT